MTLQEQLKNLIEEQNEIAGLWNGDESGSAEDNAHLAIEIVDTAESLLKLLSETE